ncbi:MAG: hypothetical protein AB7Q37_13730 [Pyrinomonadaceae bacterium]
MTDLLEILAEQFDRLEKQWFELLDSLPDDRLFSVPVVGTMANGHMTPAALVIRSAARIEQAFGGVMVRLWDDPFEWTLPEQLATRDRVTGYLNEVGALRRKGLAMFRSDEELFQVVPAPEQLKHVAEVLFSALLEAAGLQGRAVMSAELADVPR